MVSSEHSYQSSTAETELRLAVLNFIDKTTQFYRETQLEAVKHDQIVPDSNQAALQASIMTVNRCLRQLGGIEHFYEANGRPQSGQFTSWNGFDPQTNDGTHVWTVTNQYGPQSVSLDPVVTSEMRERLLASS